MSVLAQPPRRNKRDQSKRKGFADSFASGAKAGLNFFEGGYQGARQIANEVIGDDKTAKVASDRANELSKETGDALRGTVGSIDDIHNLDDAASFAGVLAGQGVGSVGAIVGALGVKKVGSALIKKGGQLLPSILKKSQVAKKAGKTLENIGTTVGRKGDAVVAAGTAGLAAGGDTAHGVREEGGSTSDAVKAGLTTAALSTAANYLPTKFALGKTKAAVKGTSGKLSAKKAAATVGTGAVLGGLSEVGDELAQETGRYVGTGNFDMSLKRLKDSFIAGALTDSAFEVGTTAAHNILDKTNKRKDDLVAAIQNMDGSKESATAAFANATPEEISTTLGELRVAMLDPNAPMDTGVNLYAAEKALAATGDLDTLVNDAVDNLDSLIATKTEQQGSDLVFDVTNPYSSFKDIAANTTPNVAAYLYSNISDGVEAGAKAATKLGIKVVGTEDVATNAPAESPAGKQEQFSVGITPTQLTDATGSVVDGFSDKLRSVSAQHGVTVDGTETTVGVYGSPEVSTNTEVTGTADSVASAVSKVASKYNQDDVIVTKPAKNLVDETGDYVARPSLVVAFKEPLSREDAVAYTKKLSDNGVVGATLTKGEGDTFTGLVATSFPELTARFRDDVKSEIESGGANAVLAKDHAAFTSAAEVINNSDAATADIVPVDGFAIGKEGYAEGSIGKVPVTDSINEHVRRQTAQPIGAEEAKAASEADVFAAADSPLDHTNFGHVAGKLGTFTGKNTEEELKLYPIPEDLTATDVPVGAPTKAKWAAVSDRLKLMLDKYGFSHDTFSFADDTFKAPRLKADGYDKGKVWIYNPYESSGAFNDPEYTKTWRIVHEVAHGITEKFMQTKYGDSRRQGALGKETEYPVGKPSKGVTKKYPPLTTAEAMRAVEWEDVSFRVQRMLFEDIGVFVSDAEFNKEYITNIADATHRVLTGEFGDAGKVGFAPSEIDAYNAYLIAMRDIQSAAEIRGTEEHRVLPRMSDARLRDAVFARTAEVNGIEEETTAAIVAHINKVVGKNFIVTLDNNLESLGEYDTAGRLIRLSSNQHLSTLYETLDHEMFHAVSANVLTKAELSVLRKAYTANSVRTKKLSKRLNELGATSAAEEVLTSPDEAAAYAYQLYTSGTLHVDSTIRLLLNKIRALVEKVSNYLSGLGFVSADGIMKAVESGVFADAALHETPNELYASVLDAESTVMHSRGHTRMYKNFMDALSNGELDHIPEEDIRAYADMLDKVGDIELTPAEKWRTVASGGWREWTKKNKVSAVMSTVDRLYPLLELDRYNTGKSSRTHAQSYMSATEAVHSAKVAYYILEHGQIKIDEAGDIVPVDGTKGLYDILSPVHDIQDTVLSYMIAKRALRVGRDVGGFADSGKGLFAEKELTAVINATTSHPRFNEIDTAAEEYYALNDSLLSVAKDTGAISEAMYDALIAHGDYVPMYRDMEGFTGAPKKAKGSNLSGGINALHNSNIQIADVLDNMHRNITGITQLISSTRAMQTIDEAIVKVDETTGIPLHNVEGSIIPVDFDKAREMELAGKDIKPVYDEGIWEAAPPLKQVVATSGSVVSSLRKQGINIDKLSKEQRDGIIEFAALVSPTGEDIVTFMRNGKRVHKKVVDEGILRAIKGITSGRSNAPAILKQASRLLVRSVVSFPAFWVVSTIRDVTTAYMTTDINLKTKDFVDGFVSAVRKDDVYKEALLSGALPTAGHSRGGDIEFDVAAAKSKSALTRFTKRGFVGTVIDAADRAANIAENISRLAVYKRALNEGMSRKQAGFLARDLLDFGKHGDNGYLLAAIDVLPFVNARVQGLYRLGTGAKEHSGRMASAIGAMMILSFALAVRNNDDERYRRLTEANKDMYWHVFLPEEWAVSHIVIPKPFELGIAATAAERLAQFTLFDGDAGLMMQRSMFAVTSTLAINPIPQAVLPVAEAAFNHSIYTGKDIVPSFLEKADPSVQVLPNTSALAKGIAQGTKHLPDLGGALNLIKSPILIDHMTRGYLATFGDYIKEASNIVESVVTGTPRPAARIPDYKILGIPRLVQEDWGRATSDKNMGYAMLSKITTVESTLRIHKKNDDVQAYREYKKDNAVYLAHAAEVKSVMGRVRKINKDIIELLKNKRKLSSEVLRKKLDAKYKRQGDLAASLRKYHKIYREVF